MLLRRLLKSALIPSLIIATFAVLTLPAWAADLNELKSKIKAHNAEIQKLEKEIATYQKELSSTQATASSLKSDLAALETTRKKLGADIKVTENEIAKTDLTIEKLSINIDSENNTLSRRRTAIAEILRRWRTSQDVSIVEAVIQQDNLSDLWIELSDFASLQKELQDDLVEVSENKAELERVKTESEKEQERLRDLEIQLGDQKIIAEQNKEKKDELLKTTQNKEVEYQKLLSDKVAERESFEKELHDLESQLRYVLDPSSLPPSGKGVLSWPLKEIFITQKFGNTEFAKSGAYNGNGHNGADFRATVGTPIYSAGAGVVTATGNTDKGQCLSYGKWILIKHDNGLSTLYGHLSLISVNRNQAVETGQMIGYSGDTGYATGPHLHLSVFASDGIQVMNLGEWYEQTGRSATASGCARAGVSIPVASYSAYLDPLLYL